MSLSSRGLAGTSNYILLGPPGSGKSTQAEWLRKTFRLEHIDIGSELRAAAEAETDFGRKLNEIINVKRELASDVIMKQVFDSVLGRIPWETGVLLDGAPRRESQIDDVAIVFEKQERRITKVIFIRLPIEISVERIARRFRCFGCHHPYILGFDLTDPQKPCSLCGGRIGQRKDDTEDGVTKRYHIFMEETMPVIEYYKKENLLLEVDGSLQKEEISKKLSQELS